jgi:hypothetical protein
MDNAFGNLALVAPLDVGPLVPRLVRAHQASKGDIAAPTIHAASASASASQLDIVAAQRQSHEMCVVVPLHL